MRIRAIFAAIFVSFSFCAALAEYRPDPQKTFGAAIAEAPNRTIGTATGEPNTAASNPAAIAAPAITVLAGIHTVPVIFNDWTFRPSMNAEVTPAMFAGGSGATTFFIPTAYLYMCSTPENIFKVSGFVRISARNNCRLRLQSYMADTNYAATDDPYPWRWKYYTGLSGFMVGTAGKRTFYTINHGEHGNVPARHFKGQGACLQAPDIGYGVLDCNQRALQWGSYNAFVSMSSMAWTPSNLAGDARFVDLGPIAWPANGYVETVNGRTIKATDGGIRYSDAIVKDGYVYVFYDDTSQGDASAGRGPGVKVMRAPIASSGVDPHSFKSYYDGEFIDPALPAGFTAAKAKDFYATKGGRSSDIFPDLAVHLERPTPGTGRTDRRRVTTVHQFGVAKVQGSDWYLMVSFQLDRGTTLRLSKDLVHWSPPTLVPGTEYDAWQNRFDTHHYMLLYPRLANASGTTNNSVDPNDFYIVGVTIKDPGTGVTQKTMQAIKLKLTLPP